MDNMGLIEKVNVVDYSDRKLEILALFFKLSKPESDLLSTSQ